jgi:hypothetical protein
MTIPFVIILGRASESSGGKICRDLRSHHPGKPSGFKVKRILGNGHLGVTEYTITYQGRLACMVSIMEFRQRQGHPRNRIFRGSLRGVDLAEAMGSADRVMPH